MVKAIRLIIVLSMFTAWNACRAETSRQVRVAILKDVSSFRLKVRGSYEVIEPRGGKVLSKGRNIRTTVTVYKDGILLAGGGSGADRILIKGNDPEAFLINDRSFRGDIEIIKDASGHLMVVNYIGLEDYVKGILYHEASHYWPEDALKAQAVACRTYAIYQMQENAGSVYDLTSDIYSQVYGGKVSERYRTNRAVDDTKGETLFYKGKIFPAYYHATCAGHTEDASELWKINLVPLKGVVCGYCKDAPHYSWHNVLTREEVKAKLRDAGYGVGDIDEIVMLDKTNSGRLRTLEIVSGGSKIKIPAKDFRNAIGPNVIKSTMFDVKVIGGDIVFEGLGWGHGVGMCQWGAYFMAKQGYNYREILKYYYPESYVKTLGF
ncbi:MAG: SpoIID/LytB domain-containing protein [Candidatus Omnitrophota bacterium]